jgi:putative ATPase
MKQKRGPGGLFEQAGRRLAEEQQPLAARMRPRTLEEFVGQEHIVGPGRLLRRAIQADRLSSLIFWGPPGSGKTTLAAIIARTTHSHFMTINAVLAGVKDIRAAIEQARERLSLHGQRSILFIDEVHRFNKAQQDALLPYVENGTIVLIGATTENPYFEVIKALVSRSRIFRLKRLEASDLERLLRRALADPERGYGRRKVAITDEALHHLAEVAAGDARSALNALELAVETTPPDADGVIRIDLAVAEESIQRRAVLYDKDGDAHYDTISAFIKSLRGSDPDAALYWMVRMLAAGEDPRFIFRRMIIFAAEDVGLADPDALGYVMAAASAFDYVGLPEGRFHLSVACLRLATAPKSNSSMALFEALQAVEAEQEGEVPPHLKDPSRDGDGFGHGAGYRYPHAFRDHWVAQQYLPDNLLGRRFYRPTDQGFEKAVGERLARLREAQAAALEELEEIWRPEALTAGPAAGGGRGSWLQRTISLSGRRLLEDRDRWLESAALARHELVLDLGCGAGFLTRELLRRLPEGGVIAVDPDPAQLERLARDLEELDPLARPFLALARPERLPLRNRLVDAVLLRNLLGRYSDPVPLLREARRVLRPGGRLLLQERLPLQNTPLHRLLDDGGLDPGIRRALDELHEELRQSTPAGALDPFELRRCLEQAGFREPVVEVHEDTRPVHFTRRQAARWLERPLPGGSTLAEALRRRLEPAALERYRSWLERVLGDRTVEYPFRTLRARALAASADADDGESSAEGQ